MKLTLSVFAAILFLVTFFKATEAVEKSYIILVDDSIPFEGEDPTPMARHVEQRLTLEDASTLNQKHNGQTNEDVKSVKHHEPLPEVADKAPRK
tara:strand:- start:210 stop:491 length:282 start_codon:yes stop_codon:yes gene_type:complete